VTEGGARAILDRPWWDREELLKHPRQTRFAPGNEGEARDAARRIARDLKQRHGLRVHGIGSLFCEYRPFLQDSDIDLVVEGLPPNLYFAELTRVNHMSRWPIDLIPWETASWFLREIVREEGVEL
jgi:hypothetical protein